MKEFSLAESFSSSITVSFLSARRTAAVAIRRRKIARMHGGEGEELEGEGGSGRRKRRVCEWGVKCSGCEREPNGRSGGSTCAAYE